MAFFVNAEPTIEELIKSSEVLAKEQKLAKALPKKQQVPVEINSKLEGNTVRVRYDPTEKGGIGNIRIEAGPEATAADIAAHGRTVKSMQQYQGLSLHVQKLKDQLRAWVTKNGNPPVGSTAWEARLEVDKLQPMIRERAKQLAKGGLDEKSQAALTKDLESLKRQMAGYQKDIKEMSHDPGKGYVAAKLNGRDLASERRLPPAEDGYHWTKNENGELRIDRNPDQTHLPQKDYDPVSKTFVERTTQAKPMEKFASHATVDEVFKKLTGKNSTSSFKPYAAMLKKAGIIKKAEELKAFINEMKFQGRSVDDVRHALKERFNQQVVDKITNVSDAAMRKKYPDLPWGDTAKAMEQAKHQEFRRVTEGLNGSDKGKFAEKWYKEVYGTGADGQVKIPQSEIEKLGLTFERDRIPDFVQGNKIKEIKDIQGKITPASRDQKQFNDVIKIADRDGGIEVVLKNGSRRNVENVNYVFTDPRGVKANAQWMFDQLQNRPKLSFEVFNWKGERKIITQQSVGPWMDNLDHWLSK